MNVNTTISKKKFATPVGLSVLQIVVPQTSVSQPDHIGCSGGNYEVTSLEVFPALGYHIITSFESPRQHLALEMKTNLAQLIMAQCSNTMQGKQIAENKYICRQNKRLKANLSLFLLYDINTQLQTYVNTKYICTFELIYNLPANFSKLTRELIAI